MHDDGSFVSEVEIGSIAAASGGAEFVVPHVTSGVLVVIHDGAGVTGVAYVLRARPRPEEDVSQPGLFASLAIPELVAMMKTKGAVMDRARAALFGAACGRAWQRPRRMASAALAEAHARLADARVPIVLENVGGTSSRRVRVARHGAIDVDVGASVPTRYALQLHDVARTWRMA